MKVSGNIVKLLVKADLFMLMGMFMTEIGKMIKLMGLEYIHILMEQGMKANGRKTNNMEKVLKRGTMELLIKELM